VPDSVCTLPWLMHLDLSFNQTTSYPELFRSLTRLESLFVNNNQLTDLPLMLPALRRLDICFNRLKALVFPPTATLPRLKMLAAKDNQIEKISPHISFLTSLKRLLLGTNNLAYLPVEIRKLTRLVDLKVGGNPRVLAAIPKESLRSREALFQFLEDSEKGSQSFSTVKLMFVGDGNVGKTSLLRALKRRREKGGKVDGKRDGRKEENIATDGIHISDYEYQDPKEAGGMVITYSCWDFAGQ
jgi:Leucine-rich repeat (LRR) protein